MHSLVGRCVLGIVCQFFVILPDMSSYGLYEVFALYAKMSGLTVGAHFRINLMPLVAIPINGAVVQRLVFRTDDAIEMYTFYKTEVTRDTQNGPRHPI